MNQYSHLSIEEREKAMVLWAQGNNKAYIAKVLGRSRSTISREFARNVKKNAEYSASYAQTISRRRKHKCGRKAILLNKELYMYVIERMHLRWFPEQIAERAKVENYHLSFSYSAICCAIDKKIIPVAMRKLMRFRWQRKAKKSGDKRGKIADTVSIHKRPMAANERTELGHWESDTELGQSLSAIRLLRRIPKCQCISAIHTCRGKEETTKTPMDCYDNFIPKEHPLLILRKKTCSLIWIYRSFETASYYCKGTGKAD